MRKARFIAVLSVIMVFFLLAGCSMFTENEEKVEYQFGTIASTRDIDDYFVLTGSAIGKSIFGPNNSVYVHAQQTTDGGWVAWIDNRYLYTESDVGSSTIIFQAAMQLGNVGTY